jgi:hypothetical protein
MIVSQVLCNRVNFVAWSGLNALIVSLECLPLLLQWMWHSENLDDLNGGGWGGIYSFNHYSSRCCRWRTGQSCGAPDNPVVHRTILCWLSGACHDSAPLRFGAVDLWSSLSSSCTGQSGGTPDMFGAFWLRNSDFWLLHCALLLFTQLTVGTFDRCSIGSPDTIWCTPDSPVNYSRVALWETREWPVGKVLDLGTEQCLVHTGQCPVRHW